MRASKVVLDGTANPESVLLYMEYLASRTLLGGKGKGKDVLDKKSLTCQMEALADLKLQQIAKEPHRFETESDRR